MPFAVKRKSTVSASFRRLKITIQARNIEGLPPSDELLQLRVKDRSRETKTEGAFVIDSDEPIDLSDLSLEFYTIVSANI